MKVGDLVSVNALKDYYGTPNRWIVTAIENRGSDHRGKLILCHISPLYSKQQSSYWKWIYELEVLSARK